MLSCCGCQYEQGSVVSGIYHRVSHGGICRQAGVGKAFDEPVSPVDECIAVYAQDFETLVGKSPLKPNVLSLLRIAVSVAYYQFEISVAGVVETPYLPVLMFGSVAVGPCRGACPGIGGKHLYGRIHVWLCRFEFVDTSAYSDQDQCGRYSVKSIDMLHDLSFAERVLPLKYHGCALAVSWLIHDRMCCDAGPMPHITADTGVLSVRSRYDSSKIYGSQGSVGAISIWDLTHDGATICTDGSASELLYRSRCA